MQIRRNKPGLGDWDDLRFFLAVARAGRYTHAAVHMKTDATTIGRRVQGLEQRLGVKLFDRIAGGMRLTPAGQDLLVQAEQMEQVALSIERQLAGSDQEMSGRVRVAAPGGLSAFWLTRHLVAFQAQYPAIQIETLIGTTPPNLAAREADISVQVIRPQDPRAVARKAGLLRCDLFAAESYVTSCGLPASLNELPQHRVVDHVGYLGQRDFAPWQQIVARLPQVSFVSNSSRTFLEAIRSGAGMGLLPRYYQRFYPDLVRVPVDVPCVVTIWLVSHRETNGNARIQALLRYLWARFEEDRQEWFS